MASKAIANVGLLIPAVTVAHTIPSDAPADTPAIETLATDFQGTRIRILSPVVDTAGMASARITYWADQQEAAGLLLGGRRLSFPADASGAKAGKVVSDLRYYNVDFRRTLETSPFTWAAPVVDTTAGTTDSTGT